MFKSLKQQQGANNESSDVFDKIKPGRRVKLKGYRQQNVNNRYSPTEMVKTNSW